MLKNLEFNQLEAKLNLSRFGSENIGLFAAFRAPNSWRLSSIGFYIYDTEFKIGPSLLRQWGRFQMKDIVNDAKELKITLTERLTDVNINPIIINRILDNVKDKCCKIKDKDNLNFSYDVPLSLGIGFPISGSIIAVLQALDICNFSNYISITFVTASVSALTTLASRLIKGTDVKDKYELFKSFALNCKNIEELTTVYILWDKRIDSELDSKKLVGENLAPSLQLQ